MLRWFRLENVSIYDITLFSIIKAKAPTIVIVGTFLVYEVKVDFYFIIITKGLEEPISKLLMIEMLSVRLLSI